MAPVSAQLAECEGGFAQPEGSVTAYPCNRVDMLSRLSHAEMGNAVRGNDLWGWTDPKTGREYALVGQQSGTAFVDVTDEQSPVYLGTLPTHISDPGGRVWRDIKVYADHAYVVSEENGHGMQVFDLTQLRDVESPPVTFAETAHYDGVSGSHNVVINETTGFAYVVGAQGGTESGCAGGLHMVDLAEPAAPAFAGCFAEQGYVHDAQCVVYDGPDGDYTGREVCVTFNEDFVALVDVTDKATPAFIAATIYPNVAYTHQGWLTEDHRFLIGNDELDERNFGNDTRTLVFDVTDLDEPEFQGEFLHDTPAIDHNLYVRGQYVYQTNDAAGFRILDAAPLLGGAGGSGGGSGLEAAAYFDTHPETDAPVFEGTWSNYPYFASGNVIVNDRSRGLFVLRPTLSETTDTEAAAPDAFALSGAYPNPFTDQARLTLRLDRAEHVTAEVYDALGRRVAILHDGPLPASSEHTLTFDARGLPAGSYFVQVRGETAFPTTRRIALVR